MKNISEIKKVYCIGLGGVGVSAVAKLFLSRGVAVSGSDLRNSPIIDDVVRAGGIFYPDENSKYITNDINLVVATDDAAEDHPQRLAAAKLGIEVENFSVTLGRLLLENNKRLCVSGTNGKSTTSALTGLLLSEAGLDPTVFVGSRVTEFNGNLRIGKGNIFVAEADEYRDHFLNYSPTVITLNNIEPDHLDYFGDEEKMLISFKTFVNKLPSDGILVANADEEKVMQIAKTVKKVFTFGIYNEADLRAIDVKQTSGQQTWTTMWRGKSLGNFTMHLPGEFNIMNSLAAMAGALAVGADPSTFASTIEKFHGVWRRFQILNPFSPRAESRQRRRKSPITIVSDYAHHPTAVSVTLAGAKKFYPNRRIVAVFQPHHQSRLTALFDDFVKCFGAADEVMIVETYKVPGRDIPETMSKTCNMLIHELEQQKIKVTYAPTPNEAETLLKTILKPGDVAIIMGAGDIWRNAESLGQYYV